MLEIRISLPLKEALADHCRSTGVNRSAFVRAAIEERMARERQAAPAWIAAGGGVITMIQSRARAIGAASLIVAMAFSSALSLRPDERSMLLMLEIADLAPLAISTEASAERWVGEVDRLSNLKEVR